MNGLWNKISASYTPGKVNLEKIYVPFQAYFIILCGRLR